MISASRPGETLTIGGRLPADRIGHYSMASHSGPCRVAQIDDAAIRSAAAPTICARASIAGSASSSAGRSDRHLDARLDQNIREVRMVSSISPASGSALRCRPAKTRLDLIQHLEGGLDHRRRPFDGPVDGDGRVEILPQRADQVDRAFGRRVGDVGASSPVQAQAVRVHPSPLGRAGASAPSPDRGGPRTPGRAYAWR